jgi:hypothetical protein
MAGTLTISTLSDGTNSTSSTNCIQGSAKAWVNFDGTPSTPTIRAAYNVSSVTKISTGQYNVNFTSSFADTNYSVAGFAGDYVSGNWWRTIQSRQSTNPLTTTAFRFETPHPSVGNSDTPVVSLSFFR